MQDDLRLLRPKTVCELLQISPTTLWRLTKDKHISPPIKLGGKSVGYPQTEIEDFINQRKMERP